MWRIQWHKERKYNPQGGSIPPTSLPRVASYRRQPWAIESTTPMGLPYHCPFITTTTTGMRITLRWSCAHHGHLSSRHNMECDHTTTWGCPTTNHLLPHHNAKMVHDMAFIITPQYGVLPYHNMGLRAAWPLITTPQHEDEDNIEMELRPSFPIHYRDMA